MKKDLRCQARVEFGDVMRKGEETTSVAVTLFEVAC